MRECACGFETDLSRDGDKLQVALQELLDLYVNHGPESKVGHQPLS